MDLRPNSEPRRSRRRASCSSCRPRSRFQCVGRLSEISFVPAPGPAVKLCGRTGLCEPGDLAAARLVDVDVAVGLVDRHARGVAQRRVGQVRGYHRSVRGQFGGLPFARVDRGDEVRVAAGRDHVEVGLVGRTFATVELLGAEEVEGAGARGHPGAARERDGIALPVAGGRVPAGRASREACRSRCCDGLPSLWWKSGAAPRRFRSRRCRPRRCRRFRQCPRPGCPSS